MRFLQLFIILGLVFFLTYFIFFLITEGRKKESYSQNVTLYSSDGREIRRWVSKGAVYCYNNSFKFYDKYSESENENMIQISGTVIVEWKHRKITLEKGKGML